MSWAAAAADMAIPDLLRLRKFTGDISLLVFYKQFVGTAKIKLT